MREAERMTVNENHSFYLPFRSWRFVLALKHILSIHILTHYYNRNMLSAKWFSVKNTSAFRPKMFSPSIVAGKWINNQMNSWPNAHRLWVLLCKFVSAITPTAKLMSIIWWWLKNNFGQINVGHTSFGKKIFGQLKKRPQKTMRPWPWRLAELYEWQHDNCQLSEIDNWPNVN